MTTPTTGTPGATAPVDIADAAPSRANHLRRGLTNRHIQLIALGGAIGTGLFYGAGASISMAGPSILLAYLLGGGIIFLIMRALGEMSVHSPTSGAFSDYAYKYVGPFAGFFSGWNYWFNYIAVSMAELVVVGTYLQFWFPDLPTWVTSAVTLVVITAVNLVSVRAYGEFEFWFAIVKVVAIVAMILFGLGIIVFGLGNGGHATGVSNLVAHGGFFPHGGPGFAMAMVVVLFSFGGVELIGITAGEARDPHRTIPKAINGVVGRILLFYIGAIAVMLAIFPWNQLGKGESPFVAIFDRMGIPAAATILNVVVLTAAVSAYNSGLYANGRMLYSLAKQGNAPRVLAKVNKSGSPFVGVLASSAVTAVAVLLNALVPGGQVFMYVMSVALIAGIFNWSLVLITQLCFRRRIGAEAAGLSFRMPFFPVANYVVLAALAATVVLMALNPDFRVAVFVGPVWAAILGVAYLLKRRVAPSPDDASSLSGRGTSETKGHDRVDDAEPVPASV